MEQLLVQGGAIGILAWIVWQYNKTWQENNREWRAYLTERNGKLEKALDKLGATLEKYHHQ